MTESQWDEFQCIACKEMITREHPQCGCQVRKTAFILDSTIEFAQAVYNVLNKLRSEIKNTPTPILAERIMAEHDRIERRTKSFQP